MPESVGTEVPADENEEEDSEEDSKENKSEKPSKENDDDENGDENTKNSKEVAGPKLVNKPVDILPLKDLELKCDKETEAFEVLKVFLNVY